VKDLRQGFAERFQGEPRLFWAPGRVNLIGEHTDYNDGLVLPAAIHLGCRVAAAPRTDGKLAIHSAQLDQTVELTLSELTPLKHWSDYPAGVASVLMENGLEIGGASLYVDSQVPQGAGLSSSAALEVGVGAALWALGGQTLDLTQMARWCQTAEHRFPGTKCGIMDQFISCHGRSGQALMLDCRDLSYVYAPLPEAVKLVVCNSKTHHNLASSQYNARREDCIESARLLGVASLRDATLEQVATLPPHLARRARHVVSENERVSQAAEAMQRGELQRLGELMAASHRSLRDDYEVSCPELDILVDLAQAQPGTVGARMTGGGFGGCTVNLVKAEAVEAFQQAVAAGYLKATGKDPDIWVTFPHQGVHEL
jgi:galactokinase